MSVREASSEPLKMGPSVDVEQVEYPENASGLSAQHRDFLMQHHGTLDLDPVPSEDPADPLNWPSWKKHLNLAVLSFHGFMNTFNAVGIVPAVGILAKLYDVDISTAVYLGTCQLITLGLGPLFWTPFADRWGRLPVWLVSALGSALFNIGCSESTSYASHMVCRLFQGFFISPGITLVQGVVVDMFFAKHRGQKMGLWVVSFGLGSALGPLTMGYVARRASWQWVYRIAAIIEFVLALAYIFVCSETLYRPGKATASSEKHNKMKLRVPFHGRIDPTPLKWLDFISPLFVLRHLSLSLVMLAYSIAHNFVLTFGLVEISALYIPHFGLDAEQVGLNYLSIALGLLLGEQLSGPLSDFFRNLYLRRKGYVPSPSQRLWISQVGNLLVIIGLYVFLAEIKNSGNHWNIRPDIGLAASGFGVQMVATPCITYVSDKCSREESASLGVTINFVRLIWAFVSPFWYPYMIESCGLIGSGGVILGLSIAFVTIPLAVVQVWGRNDSRPRNQVEVATA